jgi:hypothetical protein
MTAVHAKCAACGVETVLPPGLIQERQRSIDLQFIALERARQFEQQRLVSERAAEAKRAASRRSRITVAVVFGIIFALPALAIGSLVALGVVFGKKATHWMQVAQDPKKNGMPAILSELRKKQAEGCERVMFGPEMRMGGSGVIRLDLEGNGPCVHLMGATGDPAALLGLEQSTAHTLAQKLPAPAPAFDYRLCASESQPYEFSVSSNVTVPYTIAAIACPRTVAEGRIRSVASDPVTTSVAALRDWVAEFCAKGCQKPIAEPSAVQGSQIIDVDSTKGGPCFNFLAMNHFSDAPLSVKLTSPSGKVIAAPEPATRIHLEYCPNETGRHQLEIVPSTKDHYAVATLDCPRSVRK